MELKRTPLYDRHKALGGRLVEFAGWEMPVQYTGVVDEHKTVRSACGLFDVSHMGEVEVTGPKALECVQKVTTNDASKISEGRCQYTLICYPEGGVVDDCIVYKLGPERYLFCVNASNTEKALNWIREHAPEGAAVEDKSSHYAQIALQGPASLEVMKPLTGADLEGLRMFRFVEAEVAGVKSIVSRTGYTGEDGFEVYLAAGDAPRVWDAIMDSGASFGIKPAGLGARDTLRLEAGLPLYGHELTKETTPLEAGLKRFVSLKKGDFIGRPVLAAQAEKGVEKRLTGLAMEEPGIPRAGYRVTSGGEDAGAVTSGTMSPMLGKGIAMAYLKTGLQEPGTALEVVIRKRSARAVVTKPPFYKKSYSAA